MADAFSRARLALLVLALAALFGVGWARADAAVTIGGISAPASDLVAGKADADYEIKFTTTVGNAANSIIVTFPAGYTVGASAVVEDLAATDHRVTLNGVNGQAFATVTTNPAARQVAVVLSGGTALNGGINGFRILSGIMNPTVSGTTGAITVTTDAASETASGATVVISPGALTNGSVSLQSGVASATGNVSVSFKTANPVPAGGRIGITFPAGFVLNSGATTQVVSDNISGGVSLVTLGQTATPHRLGDGAAIPSGATVTFTLNNIQNPANNVTTGAFSLLTQNEQGQVIDSGTAAGAKVGHQRGAGQSAGKVTICHKGKLTITISVNALRAHERMAGFLPRACGTQ